MSRIIDAEERLEIIRARRNRETEKWEKIRNMSFYQRLMLPEFIEDLKKLEIHQEEAFNAMIKRDFPQLKDEARELFITFFKELLDEKVHDMRAFMRSLNYTFPQNA